MNATATKTVQITAPNIQKAEFFLKGTAPLVVERFSKKAELMAKMQQEPTEKNKKKVRTARDYDQEADEARYYHADGWQGVNAAAFRAGLISACRLVGAKMTIAKMSVFVEQDGVDRNDGLPIVRLYGSSNTFTAHTRNATGVVDVRARPMYSEWMVKLRISFDADQFGLTDVVNLMARVGAQVGIGAGRADSKASAGCGWGSFAISDEAVFAEFVKTMKG